MINRKNLTHVEYCKHIDIVFEFLPGSDYAESIKVQHHTSLLGKTQQQLSLRAPTLFAEITPEAVTSGELLPTEITTDATTLAAIVESPAGQKDSMVTPSGKSRRRRSIKNCEDACYEVSIVHFEISFNPETSNFQIRNGKELIFNEIVNVTDILIDRDTGYQILEDIEIKFHDNENFYADVPKIRYESIPAQYSPLPKRNNKSQLKLRCEIIIM